jgi:pyruvate dehydrogenase E1 component alpha subunit
MHLYDVERGNLGANAVVGGGLPAITGAALSFKLRNEAAGRRSRSSATGRPTSAPSTSRSTWPALAGPGRVRARGQPLGRVDPETQHSPIRDLSKRAEAFGMKTMKADGQDVEEVHRVATRALKHARDGKGPVFMHVETERLVGHYIGDPQVYRDKEQLHELQETRDPITLFREKIRISDDEFEATTARCRSSSRQRSSSPRPARIRKPEDALKNIYA